MSEQPIESPTPKPNADFFSQWEEEEEFEFKAITQGLGFHQKEEAIPSKQMRSSLERGSLPPAEKSVEQKFLKEQTYRDDLAPFYEQKINPSGPLPSSTRQPHFQDEVNFSNASQMPEKKGSQTNVRSSVRLSAWILDLLTLSVLTAIVILGVAEFALGGLVQIKNLRLLPEFPFFVLLIFSFNYLFYFSLLEKTGIKTLGQNVMQIRVCALDHQSSYWNFFMRTLLSYLSCFCGGLICLVMFHEKISLTEMKRA